MNALLALANRAQDMLDELRKVDFLGPLALRLYLVPVFWVAGMNKVAGFENVVAWFENAQWGLGLPFPRVMVLLVIFAELGGSVALMLGFATRWMSLPLIATMLVAIFKVHWENGWQAVADPKSAFPPADIDGVMQRLDQARDLLTQHGDYAWLTERGNFVISNNGIEWAVTYLAMLLALLFMGPGRFVSLDYWISRKWRQRNRAA